MKITIFPSYVSWSFHLHYILLMTALRNLNTEIRPKKWVQGRPEGTFKGSALFGIGKWRVIVDFSKIVEGEGINKLV